MRVLALGGTLFAAFAWAADPSRGAASTRATPSSRPAAASQAVLRPHALKLLINGKTWPITPLQGPDRYTPIPAGKLRVEARWTTNAHATGYYVSISTTAPAAWHFRSCFTGTSCLVRQRVPIFAGEEMSWSVKLMATKGQKLVGGFMVCLVGRRA
jgi:hypothetical protein